MQRSTHAPAPRKREEWPDFGKHGPRSAWGFDKSPAAGPAHPTASFLPPRKAGRPKQVFRGRS